MFQYLLGNLLANNEGALGALFVDGSGETIDLACASGNPYDLRVMGAYLGITLRKMERMLLLGHLGQPHMVHIEKSSAHIYAVPLPDGCYLALVQRRPALVARARASLEDAVQQLRAELFPGPDSV